MKKERDFKSSSTSTILLNSTINAPNVKLLIKAVATLLHSNLIEDLQEGKTISTKGELYYFSEDKYINENPEYFDEERIKLLKKTYSQEDISGFIEVNILNIYIFMYLINFSPNFLFITLIKIKIFYFPINIAIRLTKYQNIIFLIYPKY